MKTSVFLMIFFLASPLCHAGSTVGNGGMGLRLAGKVSVLDLIEAGVESNPVFDLSTMIRPAYLSTLTESRLRGLPGKALAKKLSEIRDINPLLGDILLASTDLYSWRFVAQSLIPIEDVETSIPFKPEQRVQLAIRSGRTIWINQDAWAELDEANRVALILHEMIYAVIPPRELSPGTSVQESLKARQLNGYLFTLDLKAQGWLGLKRLAPFDYSLSSYVGRGLKRIRANPIIRLSLDWRRHGEPGRSEFLIDPDFDQAAIKRGIEGLCSSDPRGVMTSAIEVRSIIPEFVGFNSPEGPKTYLSFEADHSSLGTEVLHQATGPMSGGESCVKWAQAEVSAASKQLKRFR